MLAFGYYRGQPPQYDGDLFKPNFNQELTTSIFSNL